MVSMFACRKFHSLVTNHYVKRQEDGDDDKEDGDDDKEDGDDDKEDGDDDKEEGNKDKGRKLREGTLVQWRVGATMVPTIHR